MGRSKLSRDELSEYIDLLYKRKSSRIAFRLTDEERNRYEELAKKHGVKPSAMIRENLLSNLFFKGVKQ